MTAAYVETEARERGTAVVIGGRWDVAAAGGIDATLRALKLPRGDKVTVDAGKLERLDTAGAWLLHRTLKQLKADGVAVELANLAEMHKMMLDQVAANDKEVAHEPPPPNAVIRVLAHLGEGTVDALDEGRQVLGFFGQLCIGIASTIVRPWRLRFTPLVYQIEQVGLNALPIVGLISFLIGIVLAYQGAVQLQRFGAEIFVVNLIGVSVLREIGILLTAIVVAGRSGSAFAAQIGSMKLNEEVDAMRTLGLDPMEVLVLPRVLGLVIAMPLLAFFADIMGLLGGGLMAWIVLDIAPVLFIDRLNEAVSLWSFWVGIIKAPVFGLLIAMVGCLEGLRVTGSAESVGKQTTRAVVTSIFLVIVVDALFSIFFSTVGV